jgi:beta-fructofuranosidase
VFPEETDMIPAVADPTTLDGGGARRPLLPETDPRGRAAAGAEQKRPPATPTVLTAVVSAVLLLVLVAVTVLASQHVDGQAGGVPAGEDAVVVEVAASRGVAEGVSEKSTAPLLGAGALQDFSWTNAMLAWQRTAFHFQPPKNWMNG